MLLNSYSGVSTRTRWDPKQLKEMSSQVFKIQPANIYVALIRVRIEIKCILIHHHQII